MGKQSRQKAARRSGERESTAKEEAAQARKAVLRGHQVGPAIADYERAAALGHPAVAVALIARLRLRMEATASIPEALTYQHLTALAPISTLDPVLHKVGVDIDRFPSSYLGSIQDHAAWGVDSAVAAVRLMLAGQYIGAAAIARQQLERWTTLAGEALDIHRGDDEPIADYISRVWTVADGTGRTSQIGDVDPGAVTVNHMDDESNVPVEEPQEAHAHVPSDDGEICPHVVYALLSEILHGDECREAIAWEASALLAADELPGEARRAVAVIDDAVTLALRQVRYVLSAISPSNAGYLLGNGDRFSQQSETDETPPSEIVEVRNFRIVRSAPLPRQVEFIAPPLQAILPLTPGQGLRPSAVAEVSRLASAYRRTQTGQRPAGRLYTDDEFITLAFASHRLRSIEAAQRALGYESDALGKHFHPEALDSRVTGISLVAEFASLASSWESGHNETAASCLSVIGSGTRSALWLWLEDDDRAMATLRSVLEQAARLRVHRLKPMIAERLEARSGTTPRDWLDKAGWKRLGAMARALSEYSHGQVDNRWLGAWGLLRDLQPEANPETALYTGRGAALEFVTILAGREAIAWVREHHSPSTAEAFEAIFRELGYPPEVDASIEDTLNHIWEHRNAPLGPYHLRPRRKTADSE